MTRPVDFSRGQCDQKAFDNLMALTGAGALKRVLFGSATIDPPSLGNGAGTTMTMNVVGAAIGDGVLCVSAPYDLQGVTVTGYVSAVDTVSIRLQNNSGGTVELASGPWLLT